MGSSSKTGYHAHRSVTSDINKIVKQLTETSVATPQNPSGLDSLITPQIRERMAHLQSENKNLRKRVQNT